MSDSEKLNYICSTLNYLLELLPKNKNVILNVDDDKLHQLSARTKIAVSLTKELSN